MLSTDKVIRSSKRTKRLGSLRGPHTTIQRTPEKVRVWQKVIESDVTVRSALNYITNSVISTIGMVTHPDNEIQNFLNNVIVELEDTVNRSWHQCLADYFYTLLWSGSAVAENIFSVRSSQLTLSDIITFHPLTIFMETDNDTGRLVAIRQHSISRIKDAGPLPLWKILYSSFGTTYGDYYGQSLIAPVYKWVRLKELLIDQMVAALSTFGEPKIYIIMEDYLTQQYVIDPSTGEQRPISSIELMRKQIEEAEEGSVIIIPKQQQSIGAPSVGTITNSINVGSVFVEAIAEVDQNIAKGLLVPGFLLGGGYKSDTEEVIVRRMELFHELKESYRQKVLSPIKRNTLRPLMEWNFNRSSVKETPDFTRVYSDRPEDRVATMQMIQGLSNIGAINLRNSADWRTVRQMVRLNDRDYEPSDLELIDELIAAKGRSDTKGRPSGVSVPQNKPRPKTRKKPQGRVTIPDNT